MPTGRNRSSRQKPQALWSPLRPSEVWQGQLLCSMNSHPGMAQEIRDAIMMAYFYGALFPGNIFPQQRPSPSGYFEHCSRLYCPPDRSALSAMNRSLYYKFRQVFWSQNNWVIGPGFFRDTVTWLRSVPADARKLIRKVEINFSIIDFEWYLRRYRNALAKALGQEPQSDKFDLPTREVVQVYDDQLTWQWTRKFQAILELELEELTLDFTDAVSLDGKFLGSDFARYDLWPWQFRYQFPRQLSIWAPNGDQRDEIYDLIRSHNSDLLAKDNPADSGWPEVVAGGTL